MKNVLVSILVLVLCFCAGCSGQAQPAQIAATTLPVYTFCSMLCDNTPLTVTQLVQDNVSCLHDYTLQVSQMKIIENAEVVVINGAGLEDFLGDALSSASFVIDSSEGIETDHPTHDDHDHASQEAHSHDHNQDAHIWLSPELAKIMANNICGGLSAQYPQYADAFRSNLSIIETKLDELRQYGEQALSSLSCRELITFHDGFFYFAESFDLHILEAIEEEAGSETSAAKLIKLIQLVKAHKLKAVFTEVNGSSVSASIVAGETGIKTYTLDMAISQGDYFDIMYHNINTVKEAME